MDKFIPLSDNEKQIVDTLWREGRSLSRSEIIDLTVDKTWKVSSIHILLNQLIDKGAIEVDGFIKTGTNYGRTYKAVIKKDYYDKNQLELNFQELNPEKSVISKFLSFLAENDKINQDDLRELNKIVKDKKYENKEGEYL